MLAYEDTAPFEQPPSAQAPGQAIPWDAVVMLTLGIGIIILPTLGSD